MEISDNLLCLYSAHVTEQDETYTIEVPNQEIHQGNIQSGESYKVAIISSTAVESPPKSNKQCGEAPEGNSSSSQSRDSRSDPPVAEGETRKVEIENIGDQGDGIAKIDRGYVVIVPDTDFGERVTVRLNDVRENVGFAEVLKRHHDIVRER